MPNYKRPSHCKHGNPTFDHCNECLPITVMHPASVATKPAK